MEDQQPVIINRACPPNCKGNIPITESLELTDEEIFWVMARHHNSTLCMDMNHDTHCWEKDIAKAQLAKIHQWGNEPCPHKLGTPVDGLLPRRMCERCWKELVNKSK